jgi:hypothetical protein
MIFPDAANRLTGIAAEPSTSAAARAKHRDVTVL